MTSSLSLNQSTSDDAENLGEVPHAENFSEVLNSVDAENFREVPHTENFPEVLNFVREGTTSLKFSA